MTWDMLSLVVVSATVAIAGPAPVRAEPPTFLEQGWTKETRELFYYTPQGSRFMPYTWFMALETVDGQELFADTAHLQTYGFIPADGAHSLNPGELPIGFAIDPIGAKPAGQSSTASADPVDAAKVGQYVGITCAACHTSNVTVAGRPIRIDGGASHLDFDRFYADLSIAVSRTMLDPQKFQRFAPDGGRRPQPKVRVL